MNPITDAKPVRRVFRIVSQAVGTDFELVNDLGVSVKTGPSPRRLSDYALENGADDCDHDYNIVEYEGRR